MTKLTYLIGAGASAGALPTVENIPTRLLAFANAFSTTLYKPEKELDSFRDDLVRDIRRLHGILVYPVVSTKTKQTIYRKLHGSIDTYAKKLFIVENDTHNLNTAGSGFSKLKIIMSLFFSFEQMRNIIDIRYDTFFASILKSSSKDLPNNIKVVSWNYDCQFEMAYRAFSRFKTLESSVDLLGVVTKFVHFDARPSDSNFSIFKINGTAALKKNGKPVFLVDRANSHICNHLVKWYKEWTENRESIFSTISFAWEDEMAGGHPKASNILSKVLPSIDDSKILVIIGYSFPMFNREVDKQILKSLIKSIAKVYIQDLNPEIIKDRLISLDDEFAHLDIRLVKDYDQFVLPPEYSI